jgi:hypothetical protein
MAAERSLEFENALGILRQFARRKPNVERCELCSAEVGASHPHLIEVAGRKILCACEGCALLFSGQTGTRYKRIPRDAWALQDFQLTDAQWESLMIPINMAFFFRNSMEGKMVAIYPSPAGPTESLLEMEAWEEIERQNPAVGGMESDVEALLVNRLGQSRGFGAAEYYILPIDECYKLVGLIRMHWHGLSGGSEVWQEVGRFFSNLRARATSTVKSNA